MKNLILTSAVLAMSAAGCSSEGPAPPAPIQAESAVAASSDLGAESFALCCGTRSTLVDGIASAENLMFTSDGRLLVTGDDGVYDVRRDASGQGTATLLTPTETCKFSGLAEARGVVYVGCYDFTNSMVFAASLAPSLAFRPIATLSGIPLANGLAADSAGRLYVAETLTARIERLTFSASDPFTVASREVWLSATGLGTDGLKVSGSALYWTDFGNVNRAPLRADGSAGLPTTVESGGSIFFDDLYVDALGFLVADSTGGGLSAFNLIGLPTGKTPGSALSEPSAVVPARHRLGLKGGDLVVTEKGANRVSVYSTGL